jgi:conjugative relaxase-like TrwC/TraI family protein
VTAAFAYLDERAVFVRRGHDGATVELAEGLIAVAYLHRMSRSLDPQLHTDVVAANLTRGPDGRCTALHGVALRAAVSGGEVRRLPLPSPPARHDQRAPRA